MDVDAALERARKLLADYYADYAPVRTVEEWLCYEVGGCTCGSDGVSHMPGCGYEPITKFNSVEGASAAANAVNLVSSLLKHVARARRDVLAC